MILEEVPQVEKPIDTECLAGWRFGGDDSGRSIAVALSAKSKNALKDMARSWLNYEHDYDAQVVSSWLATRRDHFSEVTPMLMYPFLILT